MTSARRVKVVLTRPGPGARWHPCPPSPLLPKSRPCGRAPCAAVPAGRGDRTSARSRTSRSGSGRRRVASTDPRSCPPAYGIPRGTCDTSTRRSAHRDGGGRPPGTLAAREARRARAAEVPCRGRGSATRAAPSCSSPPARYADPPPAPPDVAPPQPPGAAAPREGFVGLGPRADPDEELAALLADRAVEPERVPEVRVRAL